MNKILVALLILNCTTLNAKIKSAKIVEKEKQSAILEQQKITQSLLAEYSKIRKDKTALKQLKKTTLDLGGKAVPTLIKVMKSDKYPEKNRWVATFLLGRIMGKKSSSFVSRFVEHPNWVLRMASLKTLLALKEERYQKKYIKALKDNSFIVRTQALQNIRTLKLKKLAPYVWEMLYDKKNYYQGKKGLKRSNIIKTIISTIGDLDFKVAKKPMVQMIQNKKYKDIFNELDYSLSKITGKSSPKGDFKKKQIFWNRALMSQVIK